MTKSKELSDPNSCLNKAAEDEPLFVLRGKDRATAAVIRYWISERIAMGLNQIGDEQVVEAEQAAQAAVEYAGEPKVCGLSHINKRRTCIYVFRPEWAKGIVWVCPCCKTSFVGVGNSMWWLENTLKLQG